jgi:hypothetical protein
MAVKRLVLSAASSIGHGFSVGEEVEESVEIRGSFLRIEYWAVLAITPISTLH